MKLTSDNKSCEDASGKGILGIKRGYSGVVMMMIPRKIFPDNISRNFFHDKENTFYGGSPEKIFPRAPRNLSAACPVVMRYFHYVRTCVLLAR